MTTNEVMNLDCRKEENRKIIQKVLRQIKPLSKYSDEYDIPFEAIEKAVVVMVKKYTLGIREFSPDVFSNESNLIWRATIINDINNKPIGTAYGITLYEVFAKAAIMLYSEIKKGKTKRIT